MKQFLKLIFLCAFIGFSSCNQTQLGALTAAKNFVMLPYTGIKNHFSNKAYERVLNLGTQSDMPASPKVTCGNDPESALPAISLSGIDDLSDASRDLACTCKAWGSCVKELCSCENLCPESFEIFNREPIQTGLQDLTDFKNSLNFRNSGAMMISSINGTQGYCWGHASVTSKFNRLAFFDPSDDSLRKQLESPPDSLQRKYAIQEYKKIIDNIVDNKVQSIPGFTNLHKLSSHPDLQTYIADKVAKSWANRAMSLQGMFTSLEDKPMKREESEKLFADIENKLNHYQQPQIVFTDQGEKFKTHAVLVSHIEIEDGEKRICIRDNNESEFYNKHCHNYMVINETGGVVYNDGQNGHWGELGSVKLAHNDNADAMEQYDSLRKHCSESKNCPL